MKETKQMYNNHLLKEKRIRNLKVKSHITKLTIGTNGTAYVAPTFKKQISTTKMEREMTHKELNRTSNQYYKRIIKDPRGV